MTNLENDNICRDIGIEDLELILHQWLKMQKKLQDLGDDTGSCFVKTIIDQFRTTFRQTLAGYKSAIDSLRENKVMSLKTRFGKFRQYFRF